MDIEEKFAFLWVFVNGLVLTTCAFVEFQYESVVQGLIGGQLLTFVGWAFFAEVSRRYKVVRR